jgi:hypothetical protein
MSLDPVKRKIRVLDVPEESSPLSAETNNTIDETKQSLSDVNVWEIKGLPSRGVFYQFPLTGRPLTVLEVKRTTSISSDNIDEIIDTILASAVSGINVDDILVDDKLYILYWLRAQTFINDGFDIPYTCPTCKASAPYHFSVNNIEQNYLAEDFEFSQLEFINPLDNAKIKYHPRTIGDEKKVKYFINKMKNIANLDIDLLNIAIQISEINGEHVFLENAYNYLIKDSQNFAVLLSNMNTCSCGIAELFTVKCSNCKEAGFVPITFQSSFMLPTYNAKRNT